MPHIKIYSKVDTAAAPERGPEGRDEADDEATKSSHGGDGRALPQGGKKVKQQILDEFCETTGYCRGYASFVLRNHGGQIWLGGKRLVMTMCSSGNSD